MCNKTVWRTCIPMLVHKELITFEVECSSPPFLFKKRGKIVSDNKTNCYAQ